MLRDASACETLMISGSPVYEFKRLVSGSPVDAFKRLISSKIENQ